MARAWRTLLRYLVLAVAVSAMPAWADEPDNADIRVLIDISGSMKQNDPQNLRRPALRMLVGLLQPGTEAGVWTFAKFAAELVKPGPVDDAWKARALAASEDINSPGMFTNIELVMQRAIRDWEGAKVTHRRNLLLLTDGVVDISKNGAESAVSRARILNQLVPQIRGLDARIHTIALSPRADHELLERMARETGGWYQQIETADELQRVFLKLFEQAGKPTGVPLKDNKFRVDNTIREATVLLFRADDAAEPTLTSPSGQSFGREQAPPLVSWHRDTGYDLITIADPEAGEWSLSADVDPDNRVMVVTDLKLRVSELPTRIAVGDRIPVIAYLTNDGRLITRQAFLDLVEMRAETLSDLGLAPQALNDKGQQGDPTAGDGRYGMLLRERRPHPELELVVAAESATFLREQRHLMAVVEPASLAASIENGAVITLDDSVIRPRSARVRLWVQGADGGEQPLETTMVTPTRFTAPVTDPAAPVFARVEGTSALGHPVRRDYGPVRLDGQVETTATQPQPQPEPTEPVIESQAPAPKAEPEPQPEPETPKATEPEPAPEEAPEEAAEDGVDWVMPTLVFGGVNLLLAIAGLVYWVMRRRRRGGDDELNLMGDEPIQVTETDGVATGPDEPAPDGADDGEAETGAGEKS